MRGARCCRHRVLHFFFFLRCKSKPLNAIFIFRGRIQNERSAEKNNGGKKRVFARHGGSSRRVRGVFEICLIFVFTESALIILRRVQLEREKYHSQCQQIRGKQSPCLSAPCSRTRNRAKSVRGFFACYILVFVLRRARTFSEIPVSPEYILRAPRKGRTERDGT